MVIKTDPCVFSEMKIYPGHGIRFAAKDGKVHIFISSKTRSLYHQKIKPVKLTWTQAWRRYNKKVRVDEVQRKKTRKTTRVTKAVVGMSLEEIQRRRKQTDTEKDTALAKQKEEIKKKNLEKKKASTAAKASAAPKGKAAQQPPAAKNVAKAKVQKGGKK
jgi:large subunit ribosomal protein L24e